MSYYSQHTPGYKQIKLGTCNDSLWQSACFLTSFCNLGKELEWFDYTPVAMNKIFIQNKLFSNGCMLVCPVVAKYFKLTYAKVTKDPGTICIAETNKYAPSVPQHFFLYEKGQIIDPLDPDPKWKKNPYQLVSFRVFKSTVSTTGIPVQPTEVTSTTNIPVSVVSESPEVVPIVLNRPEIDATEAIEPEPSHTAPQVKLGFLAHFIESLVETIIRFLKRK